MYVLTSAPIGKRTEVLATFEEIDRARDYAYCLVVRPIYWQTLEGVLVGTVENDDTRTVWEIHEVKHNPLTF